jgi:zinc protease
MRSLKAMLGVLVCTALIAGAAATVSWAQSGMAFQIPYQQYKLKNGLRLILSEDHSAPTYSIAVAYDVGSRNERQGRTGFAHLFEHMMFTGSENVGKGEHIFLVLNNGGNMNGTTNNERTIYYETLPSNQLDLGLFLEADRMKSLAINEANLTNQRNAVQEERRQGVDNRPYGKTFEAISDTAYDNFAYKHSGIGSMADLNAATLDDVAGFFKMYYAPNNAVLTLVGDFKSEEALAKVKKYFEAIPSQPAPPPVDTTEPAQTAERRKGIEDGFAQLARLDIVYKIPPGNTADGYALDMLGDILLGGQSSVLNQKLVRDKQVAVAVGGDPQQLRGPSLFSLIALVAPGKNPEEVEKLMYEEVEHYKQQPPSAEEMAKVKMLNRRNQISSMQSTVGRAIQLTDNAILYNDPSLTYSRVEKYNAVTPADVQRVAKKYLVETNRSVITTTPKPRAAAPARSGE